MTLLKTVSAAVLYAAICFCANPVFSQTLDPTALMDLRSGDMKKMNFHSEPRPMAITSFLNQEDDSIHFSDFHGKILLVNFWATWCAPCRYEMPSLDALQAELGGETFDVVTIATGRNPLPVIQKFFAKESIETLTIYRDPTQALAREMSIFGLPITVILNKEGQEIARLRGDADWHSTDAINIIKAIVDAPDLSLN